MGLAQVFTPCQGDKCQAQPCVVQTETGFNSAGPQVMGTPWGSLGGSTGGEQPLGADHQALEGFLQTSLM